MVLDTSPLVGALIGVGSVGAAVFVLDVMLRSYRWLRDALGFGGLPSYIDPSEYSRSSAAPAAAEFADTMPMHVYDASQAEEDSLATEGMSWEERNEYYAGRL